MTFSGCIVPEFQKCLFVCIAIMVEKQKSSVEYI